MLTHHPKHGILPGCTLFGEIQRTKEHIRRGEDEDDIVEGHESPDGGEGEYGLGWQAKVRDSDARESL